MKIYTKTGDDGSTGLYGGTRVSKDDIRIDSYGTVDELNSYIGLIRDQAICDTIKESLYRIQHDLFTVGAILATDPEKAMLTNGKERLNILKIDSKAIKLLEDEIDEMNKDLPQMTHFILPGGHTTVSFCHIARTICRRAERNTVALSHTNQVNEDVLKYLNRLSDFLFVLARQLTKDLGVEEVKWQPEKLK